MFDKIRAGVAISKAFDWVKEATVKGHGLAALVIIAGAFWAELSARVFAFCPDLRAGWFLIIVTGIATGVAAYWKKPANPGLWATVSAVGTAAGMAIYAALDSHCPGIWAQIPSFVLTTIPVAVAVAMRSPLETKRQETTRLEKEDS